jgi:uncharacterized protein YkwD
MTRARKAFARIALVAAATTALAVLTPSPVGATTTRTRMYRATNNSRADYSIREVNIHWTMTKLARKHSVAMANKGSIFHTSNPEKYYLQGVRWTTWGENVGVTGGTVAGLERAFMDSPLHRANILNRGFRRVAVGTYRDADGLLWVTIFFYG